MLWKSKLIHKCHESTCTQLSFTCNDLWLLYWRTVEIAPTERLQSWRLLTSMSLSSRQFLLPCKLLFEVSLTFLLIFFFFKEFNKLLAVFVCFLTAILSWLWFVLATCLTLCSHLRSAKLSGGYRETPCRPSLFFYCQTREMSPQSKKSSQCLIICQSATKCHPVASFFTKLPPAVRNETLYNQSLCEGSASSLSFYISTNSWKCFHPG